MIICIEKNDQGQFFVYQQDAAESAAMPGMESTEQQNKTPANDLNEALQLAGRLLSSSGAKPEAEQMFDQGMMDKMASRGGV